MLGVHASAQAIIHFGKIARKHGLTGVCLDSLSRSVFVTVGMRSDKNTLLLHIGKLWFCLCACVHMQRQISHKNEKIKQNKNHPKGINIEDVIETLKSHQSINISS